MPTCEHGIDLELPCAACEAEAFEPEETKATEAEEAPRFPISLNGGW